MGARFIERVLFIPVVFFCVPTCIAFAEGPDRFYEDSAAVHLSAIGMADPVSVAFSREQLIMPGILSVVLLLTAGFLIIRSWTEKGYWFELIAGFTAAGLGCYLGLGAQSLYISGGELSFFGNGYENPLWVGGVCGGVFGMLSGIWYAQFLRRLLSNGHEAGGVIGKGVLAGILLGVLCSTAVHVNLMAAYHNMHFGPLFIGGAFGFGAGIFDGLVFSVIFLVAHKTGLIRIEEAV